MEFDAKQIQYSLPPSRYTGALKTTDVAIDPSPDISISSGSKIISENGIMFCVGNPFCIVLSWKVAGISISSLDLKKTSQLVKKTPVSLSTKNDCASGSYHPIIPCLCVCAMTLLLTN